MAGNQEFDVDEVNQIAAQIVESIIGNGESFKTEYVEEWTDAIVHGVLQELSKLEKSFKYIVTCTINQRDGAGLYMHSACYFNTETDNVCTFRFDYNAIFAIVSVYALTLH